STYAPAPHKFEAGTPPIAQAVGLGAAIDYLSSIGMDKILAHEHALTEYAVKRLAEVPDLRIIGPTTAEDRGAAISFTLGDIHPHGRGLRDGDAEVHHVNPTCGDEITLRVKYDGTKIEDVSYEGQGCSISQASASVLNELLVGKDLADAQKIQETFLELMQSK